MRWTSCAPQRTDAHTDNVLWLLVPKEVENINQRENSKRNLPQKRKAVQQSQICTMDMIYIRVFVAYHDGMGRVMKMHMRALVCML